jgi:hypothetical protein
MPAFYKPHGFPKMGSFRTIFVLDNGADVNALERAIGKNYLKPEAPTTLGLEPGWLITGRDPIDRGSKMGRDVLLRLAKAGFTAREVTLDELRADQVADTSSLASQEHTP